MFDSSRAAPGRRPRGLRLAWRLAVPTTAVGLALGVIAPYAASASHTPEPSVVALVGTLQSEVGCPGDWQPECPQSRLQPVAGSPDLYRATFDVPAGSYEYKVALNSGWDENYGAGGTAGGANLALNATGGPVTFTYSHLTHRITDDTPKPVGQEQAAHWLAAGVIAWPLGGDAATRTYRLHSAPEGGLVVKDGKVLGGSELPLTYDPAGLPASVKAKFPHLATYDALRLPRREARKPQELLKGQLAVASYDASGQLLDITGVQTPGVLDEVYADAADRRLGLTWLGAKPELELWAPTARSVTVHVYAGPTGDAAESVPLKPKGDGIWAVTGTPSWKGRYYLYDVEVYVPETGKVEHNLVTDPYSLGLSTNSERSLFVDLADSALQPAGWKTLVKPTLGKPEDQSIYELHVRDFSINDATVPAALRGTYEAFTVGSSNGTKHLRSLAAAGLNTVHLLPTNDIATINENRAEQAVPACDLPSMAPDSEQQQACVAAVASRDGFNWGYDPLHYTAPEGSYSTDPTGGRRTREFRDMVSALNANRLRVVMDVVYNHTSDAGQLARNDLDRIVPGYYHRRTPLTGAVETSTCCPNTATEHAMMAKLMIDSVVTWATAYKVDGFRFDLMGHQPKAAMVALRNRLDQLTVKRDGVNGRDIYLYGEGWNFGEVANDARFVQATQANMAGTGIGTFNDRARDAVRGGTPFDANPRIQGFATGLYTDPNGDAVNGTSAEQKANLLLAQDQIKIGLTGNLKDYSFVDRTGATIKGSDIAYQGAPVGYTADPQEAISYVEAHDNETLFDVLAFKLPQRTPMVDRVRMQTLALATTALGQGVSFWHAGGELLRSKSLDRNSYDSGDWFNVLDFSYATNGFGRGLPLKVDNESKYPYMAPLLADPALKPGRADILTADAYAKDLLEIRRSSPLFHLGTEALVQQKLSFPSAGPGQTPGVIVMQIDDTVGADADPGRRGLVVVFNASARPTTQVVPGAAGAGYALHPVQAAGSDPVVKTASFTAAAGSFTVPARTVAVFQR